MLTIMIHAKIKPERLDEYLEMVKLLVAKTSKKGCLAYSFNQNNDDPTNFVLYEKWSSQQDLDAHINELFEILGPAKPGEPVPHKLMDLYESVTPVYYDVIAEDTKFTAS